MGCSGCPGNNPVLSERSPTARAMATRTPAPSGRIIELPKAIGGVVQVSDSDLVEAQYMSRNTGEHKIIGPATGILYGHARSGDIFPRVHKDDLSSGLFQRVYAKPAEPPPAPVVELSPPEPLPGVEVTEEIELPEFPSIEAGDTLDLQTLPGVTPGIARQLEERGVRTVEDLQDFGTDGLEPITGVGPVKAEQIMQAVESL